MISFVSLISGSSGNATFVSDGKTHILTDCGMSGTALKAALAKINMSPDDLSAILITHEHSDHVKGVGVVLRRHNIPLYATEKTFMSMNCGEVDEGLIHFIRPDDEFEIGGIGIRPFSIPHDAADPVGYNYFIGNDKISLATDIGHMTDGILSRIKGSKRVLLESNHDITMLQMGSYPFPLKQRILSDIGHLSNEIAAETALELAESGTEVITLGHLSNENNRPDIAMLETYSRLSAAGVDVGNDVMLQVAKRYEPTVI